MQEIRETEYPIFLWLNKIFEDSDNLEILDFGGALGAHYYKFKKIAYHLKFTWNIVDVPKVVEYAVSINNDNKLKFVKDSNKLKKIDIFIASGSIQYVEEFSLKNFKIKPKYLLFARLPLNRNVKKFVTLQNAISSFNPQYVYNRNDFIKEIEDLGYELIDEWKSHYDRCIIPEHKEESCMYYSGLYFRLIDV